MRPPRAIHVIAPSPAGGAESVVLALAAADPTHTSVVIINQVAAADAPPHAMAERLRANGVTVEEVRCGRRRYGAEGRALATLVRKLDGEVMHTHGYHGTVVGFLAARHHRVPLVATVHGYLGRNWKERIYDAVDRWVLRRFDAVIAVSEVIERQLAASGVPRERVFHVQNGFAPQSSGTRDAARRALGLGAEEKVVGWIGRLSPEKGPDLLIQAVTALRSGETAMLVGEGPERPRIEGMLAALPADVAARVRLAGFRDDAASLLPAFDALVLSSRTEGTPMVLLEAVAARVPIVAFAVGGVPGLLPADAAVLVPPLDVAALGAGIRRTLDDVPAASARAVLAAAHLESHLSLDRWLGRVREVYAAALARRSAQGM